MITCTRFTYQTAHKWFKEIWKNVVSLRSSLSDLKFTDISGKARSMVASTANQGVISIHDTQEYPDLVYKLGSEEE